MFRKTITACFAGAALAIAGPAIAGPGGHGGGHGNAGGVGPGATANAGMHGNMGNSGLNAGANGSLNGIVTNPAAGVSQGSANASINGITHANSHSVLASGAVPGSSLTGLMPGVNILNTSGTSIGTVSQVVTDSSGNIRLVVVTSSTGQTFRLMPNTLSVNNGIFTTTSTIGG